MIEFPYIPAFELPAHDRHVFRKAGPRLYLCSCGYRLIDKGED